MTTISRDTVTKWLVERIAYYVERNPAEIEADTPLASYGVDSVYALGLTGDIEEEFGVTLDATVVWDNPTINAIVAHILMVTTK